MDLWEVLPENMVFFFSFFSLTAVAQCFVSFLKHVITDVTPASLMGSALSSGGSDLELAGIHSVQHRGTSQCLLAKATPVDLTSYQNLAMQNQDMVTVTCLFYHRITLKR